MVEQRQNQSSHAEAKERKGLWSPEEDERLYTQITCHGVSTWSSVALLAGLRRSGKSCRLRWMNYLRPDLKKEPISRREEATIISLQKSLGNRWSVIAGRMPGRTDNEIKNYWNSRIRKRHSSSSSSSRSDVAKQPAPGTLELPSPAAREKKAVTSPPAPATRFPVFACQLPGDGANAAGTQSTTTTTTHELQITGSESEMSVGNGEGSNARDQNYCYYDGGDMDMISLLSFDDDDIEYPYYSGGLQLDAAPAATGGALLQLDAAPAATGGALLQLDDPWDSELYLYGTNSGSSLIDFAC